MFEWIEGADHLDSIKQDGEDFFLLAFVGEFSDAAQRAIDELKTFAGNYEDIPVYAVDVGKVKGLHKQFDVERVPTVLAIEDGEIKKSIEGVQSARFYGLHFGGAAPSAVAGRSDEKKPLRVTVYSGPGCPACGTLKTYLREHDISYREIDISRNQKAAQQIARRSGKMAVPQTDINGHLVVGFDRAKLNRLLGIQEEGR
ncbi:MAG: glutaredoxin domain-containing protein [Candidatus Brocadiia bacterium]